MFKTLLGGLLCVFLLAEAAAGQAEALYTPGTYTATAQGNNGGVTVEVIFDETQIASVRVMEQAETVGICEPAIETIPEVIVAEQTLSVEAVAGATVTSAAILTAVEDCVTQAGGNAELLREAESRRESTADGAAAAVTGSIVAMSGAAEELR